jgi:predicted RNA methylase
VTSRIRYNNPAGSPALGIPYHYEMVSDTKRVAPFRAAIERVCAGRRVLESGAGSAILSILAARAGADHVYAVEIDPEIARFAAANIERSGLRDRITLLHRDVLQVGLGDLDGRPVDVVIAENLSTWQVTEPQIPILNHVNRQLVAAGGIRLPAAISNHLELAETQYVFEDAVEVRTHHFGFTGISPPRRLSGRHLFARIDLGGQNPLHVDREVTVRVERAGTLNSLRLTSPLQVHADITFDSSDSLMPPVVVPLAADLAVSAGDMVAVRVSYDHGSAWADVSCTARLVAEPGRPPASQE